MQSYKEFLDLSVGFPQEGFEVHDDELYFHELNLMEMIETYGSPLRFTYLPIVSKKIQQAKLWFKKAIVNNNYRGSYTYCYCTKSSHFRHILDEVLKNDVHLETSSAFDMPIIDHLEKKGLLKKDITVICNGYKKDHYKQYIVDMLHDGFENIIPVLDNKEEFYFYDDELDVTCNLGIRIASEEQPDSQFYTSRLGIRMEDVIDFYHQRIESHPNFKVKLLHFFINSGISDTPYYWNELEKYVTSKR